MDDVAIQFRNALRQFAEELGPQVTAYLAQTYQLGEREVAFTSLIGTLMDFGYTEEELMQGPLGKLAQSLGMSTEPADDDHTPAQELIAQYSRPPDEAQQPQAYSPQQQAGAIYSPAAPPNQATQYYTPQVTQPTQRHDDEGEGVLHVH